MSGPCKTCGAETPGLYCAACRTAAPAAKQSTPKPAMNRTEARWRSHDIVPRLASGALVWCEHEAMRFRVGKRRTWYCPDFPALRADGILEVTEVKGGLIREDARAKFQAAALLYPWAHWRMVQWDRGRWRVVADYPAALDGRAVA